MLVEGRSAITNSVPYLNILSSCCKEGQGKPFGMRGLLARGNQFLFIKQLTGKVYNALMAPGDDVTII